MDHDRLTLGDRMFARCSEPGEPLVGHQRTSITTRALEKARGYPPLRNRTNLRAPPLPGEGTGRDLNCHIVDLDPQVPATKEETINPTSELGSSPTVSKT